MSRRVLACAALAAALAACASSPTRFYTLDAMAPAAAPAAGVRVPPVRVDAVHMPAGLDRPEIVRQTGAVQVRVDDFALWSAPLGEQARRALTQDLAARLPQGAVTFPEAPKPQGGRGLVVDVLALSHADGQALMDVSWTLTAGGRAPAGGLGAGGLGEGGSAPLPYTGSTLRLAVPAAGPGAAAVPQEISALLGRLADSVAADLTARR